MEIILTKQCKSVQGTLNANLGYFIVKRGERFFSQRSRHRVNPGDHWKFIVTCAQLAQTKLYIADIKIRSTEFAEALMEAGLMKKVPAYIGWNEEVFYHASDILNLKTTFSL